MAKERRICRNMSDLRELLGDYEVQIASKGENVYLLFPDSPSFKREFYFIPEPKVGGSEPPTLEDAKPENDPSGVNWRRLTRNTIRALTSSPQFWRCTTVADQMTEFKWNNGEEWGIVKMYKRAGFPFTVVFSSPAKAKEFVEAVLA